MKRINFFLPEQQIAKLKGYVKSTGLTMSEILRRALDEYFDKHKEIKDG